MINTPDFKNIAGISRKTCKESRDAMCYLMA
jgi:hypothetical protein